MRLARYWVREKGEFEWRRKPGQAGCWGWSEESEEEAREMSRSRTAKLVAWLSDTLAGGDAGMGIEYDYDTRPLREEILQEFEDDDRETIAAVTRNRYGALVLNTDSLVFLDRDIERPPVSLSTVLPRWARRLFKIADPEPEAARELRALESIHAWAETQPGVGIRIYRTAAGFRVLLTNRSIPADTTEAAELLNSADVDPLYAILCEKQESYRARLTPKPWRIGLRRPGRVWPFESARDEQAFQEWLGNYESTRQNFAVCRLVETIGPDETLEQHAPLIELHDRLTGVGLDMKLA